LLLISYSSGICSPQKQLLDPPNYAVFAFLSSLLKISSHHHRQAVHYYKPIASRIDKGYIQPTLQTVSGAHGALISGSNLAPTDQS
jgi:hypothetical protein